MELSQYIGFVGATLTTVAFLPQVIRSWRLKETKDLSLLMLLAFNAGVLFWLVYGLMTSDLPVIVANAVTIVLAGTQLVLKLMYR